MTFKLQLKPCNTDFVQASAHKPLRRFNFSVWSVVRVCLASNSTTYLEMTKVVLPLQVTHRELNRVEVEALGKLTLEGGMALWYCREGRLAWHLKRRSVGA